MSINQPDLDFFLRRFGRQLREVFYPYFLLSIIDQKGGATRKEIEQTMASIGKRDLNYGDISRSNLLGRMEKTFGMIELEDSEAKEQRYKLTVRGKTLLDEARVQLIDPLKEALDKL